MAKIKISSEEEFIKTSKDTAESGLLVELPDKFTHYGFYSFAFENSFMAGEELVALHKFWSKHIGKKVFWLALSEKGAILKQGEDKFAFIKLTSLIAFDDENSNARNIHSDGAGSFNV